MTFSPYLPPPTNVEASTLLSLLRVLADPAAAKELLERMLADKQALDDARTEQETTKLEAEKLHAEAQAKLSDAHGLRAEAERTQSAAQAKESILAAHTESLAKREASIVEKETANDATAASLLKQIQEYDARNRSATSREAKLQQREEKLAASEKAHAAWIASLKPPAGQ